MKGRRLLATSQRHVRRYVRRCESRIRGSIDRAVRQIGRRGAGGSFRSGRRSERFRIRGRAARKSGATAVEMTEAGGTTVVGAVEEGTTAVAAAAEGAEQSR